MLSCKSAKRGERVNPETVVTMESEDLGMTVSRNGLKSYHFTAARMEQYDLASEPYTKYPAGIYVETFQDSTEIVESTLRANEAIYYQNRKLWMASGNVVATGSGNTLYTQQLFWDERTDRVYSNVRVRIVDQDGEHWGEGGFESDVNFENWELRDYDGTLALDIEPTEDTEGGESETNPEPSPVSDAVPTDAVENHPSQANSPDADTGKAASSQFGAVRRTGQGDAPAVENIGSDEETNSSGSGNE